MTNDNISPNNTEQKQVPFGARLRTAREALGLDRKDAAAQLRLNENIIIMLEKDKYPTDLPTTFVRGYIRAYGKLLQIPENEIKAAIEPIQPKPITDETGAPVIAHSLPPVTSGNYFMQIFTYLIIFTLIALVGMWWYTHTSQATVEADNSAVPLNDTITPTVVPANNSSATASTNTMTPINKANPSTANSNQNNVAAQGNNKIINNKMMNNNILPNNSALMAPNQQQHSTNNNIGQNNFGQNNAQAFSPQQNMNMNQSNQSNNRNNNYSRQHASSYGSQQSDQQDDDSSSDADDNTETSSDTAD